MSYDPLNTRILGKLSSANMNSVADQAIPINLTTGATTYVIDKIVVTNTSAPLTLAAGGVYTAAAKGGTAVVAAAQVYSALTSAAKTATLTVAVSDVRTETTLFFALTVAQGTAATADVYVIGTVLK